MKFVEMVRLALPSAIVASLCCLSPLVFVLFGASVTSFGVVLFTRTLGPYEWAFFLAGLAAFAASLTIYFRSRNICTLDQVRARRREVINTALLGGVVAAIVFAVIYGSVGATGHSMGLW